MNEKMKNRFVIFVCSAMILISIGRLFGDGYNSNRQVLIAGGLSFIAFILLIFAVIKSRKK